VADRLMMGDYPMDEVSSALNKDIRRGNERGALYWAIQFLNAGMAGYLWRRLAEIAVEDCSDEAVSFLHSCHYLSHLAVKEKKSDADSNAVAKAIIKMCREPKTREASDLDWLTREAIKDGELLEVPKYALDQHTDRGRKSGVRGEDADLHFVVVGGRLDKEYPSAYKKEVYERMGLPEGGIKELMDSATFVEKK